MFKFQNSKIEAKDFQKVTRLHCSVACMGSLCKHENYKKCANPYISGVHSELVAGIMIGSQRLSDRLIKEFDMMQQFKDKSVKAVFNLEEPGEHPYCGDGIIPKIGFSYTPENLMKNQVEYYNMYWKDLQTPSHEMTVKIIQLMHKSIVEGGPERRNKVLVHCHAGQGRTAIIIGAYLLYAGICKTAEEAVILSK